ncbi:MAG: EAL domain-containing protein [Terracidiphilus sp.]|jgi:sensor c-di-GMP phosphodiesterase-like protein
MRRSLKYRFLAALVVTLVAAACGLLVGALFGRFITLRLTQRRLLENVARASTEAETRVTEAAAVMSALKASALPPCSGAELTYFRALIFDAKYLKDAGRMSDGKIECSASLARPEQPMAQGRQDMTLKGDVRVYKNLALYQSGDRTTITLQQEDYYVVLIPSIQTQSGPGPEHYSEALKDVLSGQTDWYLGDPPPMSASSLVRDGFLRQGNGLYATRCSRRFSNCITAYLSIPEALQADRTQFRIYVLLGALIGALFGATFAIFYRRSRGMEHQLRRAVRKDKLRVVYQPVVNLASKRIVGAEALARWTDEEGFEVGPDLFIKIAEDRGFVGEITKLVLRQILRDFGETLRTRPGFRLNINVTVADLADPEFLPMLEQSIDRAGVPAESLGIEITESGTARHQVAMDAIIHLRKSGHSVYVDDFGTGYSSLAYLNDLSVDVIKIDKSFTQAIGTQAVTVSILPQILSMAKALHLQVVVEGIETGQQSEYFAASEHPVFGQGWFFGRPVPKEEFHRLLIEGDIAAAAEI